MVTVKGVLTSSVSLAIMPLDRRSSALSSVKVDTRLPLVIAKVLVAVALASAK